MSCAMLYLRHAPTASLLTPPLLDRLAVSLAEGLQNILSTHRCAGRRPTVTGSAVMWMAVRDCRDFVRAIHGSERRRALDTMRAACQAWREVEARKASQ